MFIQTSISSSVRFFVSGRIRYNVTKPRPSNVAVNSVVPGNVRKKTA